MQDRQGRQAPVKDILDHLRLVTGNYLSAIFARGFAVSAREFMDPVRAGIPADQIEDLLRELIPLKDSEGEHVEPSSMAEHLVRAVATAVSAWFSDEAMNALIATKLQVVQTNEDKKIRYTIHLGNATIEAVGGESLKFNQAARDLENFEEWRTKIEQDYTGYTLLIRLPVFATMREVKPTDALAKARAKLVKP